MGSFVLARGESPPDGLRRTAVAEVRAALTSIKTLPSMEAIHEFRRATKRIRALLRIGEYLHDQESESLDHFFRHLALKASAIRDLTVRIRLLEKQKRKLSSPWEVLQCERMEEQWQTQLEVFNFEALKADLIKGLRTALRLLSLWPGIAPTRKDLKAALKKARTKAKKAREKALKDPIPDNLHSWRKRTKTECNLRHFLNKSVKHSSKNRLNRLKHLSDLLGKDHDLVLLEESLAKDLVPRKAELGTLIAQERSRLQKHISCAA